MTVLSPHSRKHDKPILEPYPYLGPNRPQNWFPWQNGGAFCTKAGRRSLVLDRVQTMTMSGGNGYKELYTQGTMGCAPACYSTKARERAIYISPSRRTLSSIWEIHIPLPSPIARKLSKCLMSVWKYETWMRESPSSESRCMFLLTKLMHWMPEAEDECCLKLEKALSRMTFSPLYPKHQGKLRGG